MNCIELNIKPCYACACNIANRSKMQCLVEFYKDVFDEACELYTMKDAIIRWLKVKDTRVIYVRAALEQYYPDHVKTLDRLSVLL